KGVRRQRQCRPGGRPSPADTSRRKPGNMADPPIRQYVNLRTLPPNYCASCRQPVHQDERPLLPLMGIDERDQPREMLRAAMSIERRPIRPFLYEDEMSGIFLVDEQVIGDAEFLLPGLLDQFAVERQDDLDGFRLDEILGDDLEHVAIPCRGEAS